MIRSAGEPSLHWTPELGDREVWLEGLRSSGWVPEYPWKPTPFTVNGRTVWPYALIGVDSFERGLRIPPARRHRLTRPAVKPRTNAFCIALANV